MTITLHEGDIPPGLSFGDAVAVDTEAMGLNNHRDRLCVVQLSAGDGTAHLVRFAPPAAGADVPRADGTDVYAAPNLKKLLSDAKILKIFHFARFDISILKKYLGVDCNPLYCTKIASYLARTYTDRHGLSELCRELLGQELNKQQQSSDWGRGTLSEEQMKYAASDVLYLHRLKEKLDAMLEREGRTHLAAPCFEFLPARAALDLGGWDNLDIFAH